MRVIESEFRVGWKVVGSAAIGVGCGLSGLPFYTSGVFLLSLTKEFGWSVGAIQSSMLVIALSNILTMPLAGWACDRIGARWVALISLPLFSMAFMLLGTMTENRFQFYALWVAVALFGAGTLPVVWSRVIVGWFDRQRGLALGITLLGTGVTAMVAPLLTVTLIANYGWRAAYVVLGALPLIALIPAFLYFREAPLPVSGPVGGSGRLIGHSVREALMDRRFWIIGIALLLVTVAVSGIISNLVKMLVGGGYSAQEAALVAGTIGLFVIIGRPSCGWLMDRFWAPAVGFAFYAGLPVACLLLMVEQVPQPLLFLVAALVGIAAAAEFDTVPFLVSRYLGMRAFGSIFGLALVFFCVGAALGPMLFGMAVDTTGSYRPALIASGIGGMVAALLMLTLGKYTYPVENDG